MASELLTDAEIKWRDKPAAQQPEWPDKQALRDVVAQLSAAPNLVQPIACDELRTQLAAVAQGRAFLLQGGDCAETFRGNDEQVVRNKLKTLLQMAVVLTYAGEVPVVKVGRMAGQYAKPRSKPTETIDGITLPAYRGDAVNGLPFDSSARVPDPYRLWQMYTASRQTLTHVQEQIAGGYARLDQLHRWNRDFVAKSPAGARYDELARDIDRALRFMRACGADPQELRSVDVFASHEGLLLDYEQALTRTDPHSGRTYATSGHMLWVGERTRQLDGAHIAYFTTIANPVGVKLGPDTTPEEVRRYVELLDPDRTPGRLTFISRMGARQVRTVLPTLIEAATAAGAEAVWACDPMHGNTFVAPSGHKTRLFTDILDEVHGFFAVHRALGTHPGGIHVEFTGEDVTECLGGGYGVRMADLSTRYTSACDPRLNRGQAIDLAFLVAELL